MTPKERAAMQQALEALEKTGIEGTWLLHDEAITSLREALAEQAEQKPEQDSWPSKPACEHDKKVYDTIANNYLSQTEQTEQSQLADASLEPVASVEEWVARPHPEDIKRLQEQRSVGHWDSHLNDIVWREGLVNADLQHGQPLYAAPLAQQVTPVTQAVRTKDLTDDEINALIDKSWIELMTIKEFARAVIAADREKNK